MAWQLSAVGSSAVTGLVVAVAGLVLATAFGLWRNRQRRPPTPVTGPAAAGVDGPSAGNGTTAVRASADRPPGAATGGSASGGVAQRRQSGHARRRRRARRLRPDPAATWASIRPPGDAGCSSRRPSVRRAGPPGGCSPTPPVVDGVTPPRGRRREPPRRRRALDIWRTPTTLVVDARPGGPAGQRRPGQGPGVAAVAPMLDRAAR